nr:MATE efflux family protein [Tanacetum cinerariifolium]
MNKQTYIDEIVTTTIRIYRWPPVVLEVTSWRHVRSVSTKNNASINSTNRVVSIGDERGDNSKEANVNGFHAITERQQLASVSTALLCWHWRLLCMSSLTTFFLEPLELLLLCSRWLFKAFLWF